MFLLLADCCTKLDICCRVDKDVYLTDSWNKWQQLRQEEQRQGGYIRRANSYLTKNNKDNVWKYYGRFWGMTSDSNNLRAHVIDLKHKFFPSHSNQTHTLQKILQIIRICSHFQNKPHKAMSRFLSNFTLFDGHYTTWKEYPNGEWIKKIF